MTNYVPQQDLLFFTGVKSLKGWKSLVQVQVPQNYTYLFTYDT